MNFIYRLLGVLLLFIDFLLQPVFWILRWSKPRKIAPIDNQIFLLSAIELADRIRQRKWTSLYVVATYIGRIKQVNPIINAISDERFDAALIEAKAADDFINSGKLTFEELKRDLPFMGVPLTVKESCGVKGLSHAVGVLNRKGFKCDADGACVHRLRAAGFIPLAVTNTPEFCFALETNNLINGPTNNPYDTNYSVGGSSGGETALISSAASVVGVASDYAGSIRLPCMCAGVFGHKTTPKIIPRTMHFPNSTDKNSFNYFSIGPITRYATDLKPMLKIMTAKEGECLMLDTKVDLKHIKVLYTEDYYDMFGIERVAPTIVNGITQARKVLCKDYKMHSQRVQFAGMENASEIATSLFLEIDDLPKFLEDPKNPEQELNLYMEIIKSIAGRSQFSIYLLFGELMIRYNAFIPKSHLPYYKTKMAQLQKNVWDKLGDNAVLLFPTFPTTAFQHYQIFTKSFGIVYSMIFNILGCPSTQVPIGLDDNGLPIGIQVIAGPKQDRLCLAVAEALEKSLGGWTFPK